MNYKLLILTLLASVSSASHPILPRDDYLDSVCSPNITITSPNTVIPPCIESETIQEICTPNGTTSLYYAAHAECMCTGSFFEDWTGCQDCLFYHGQRTERDEAFYASVVAVASHSLCDFLSSSGAPTPTTDFAGYFSEAGVSATQPTTGATISSDQAPSSTAVSLYFTLSGSQGAGAITGSLAEATATTTAGALVTGTSSTSGGGSGSTSTASGESGSTSSSSASSSSSVAAAQTTMVVSGLVLGVAGFAVAAAL